MDWTILLAYLSGSMDQNLPGQNIQTSLFTVIYIPPIPLELRDGAMETLEAIDS